MTRNPLSKKITEIKPSGIRKFFDIVSEMKDAISLGEYEKKVSIHWNEDVHFIHPMRVCRN